MALITLTEYASRHGKSISCVHSLVKRERLKVVRSGWIYLVEETTPYPEDMRKENAKNLPCVQAKMARKEKKKA